MNRTFMTKIPKVMYQMPEVQRAILYFTEWCEYFATIEHRLFVDLVHRKISVTQLKKEYAKAYGITARQFNSIRAQIEGKISAIKELKEAELLEKQAKVKSFENKLDSLLANKSEIFDKLSNTPMNSKKHSSVVKQYRKIKASIHYLKRKIQKYRDKINRLETDTSNDVVRICFGTKQLFGKQFRLDENQYKNHDEWLKDWKTARNSQFFSMGSSDETFGNQNVQYDKNNNLIIRVAKHFEKKYGKYVTIPNVTFKYGQNAIDRCKDFYMGETRTGKPQKYYNTSVSYRIMQKEHGWYIAATVQVDDVDIITDSRLGAIGVDFNVNFVSVCFIDRFGNPIKELTIKCPMYNKTTGQLDGMLGRLAYKLCKLAQDYKIPLIIEDLSFANAKRMIDTNKKYKRMINSFPYGKFRDALNARASNVGVDVIAVNPAYTSIIGQFKFMKKYGLSSHGAAACAIARKGLNFYTPKIEKHRKEYIKQLLPKLNMNIDNYKMWKELSSIVKKHLKFNDRIQMLYSNLI